MKQKQRLSLSDLGDMKAGAIRLNHRMLNQWCFLRFKKLLLASMRLSRRMRSVPSQIMFVELISFESCFGNFVPSRIDPEDRRFVRPGLGCLQR
jgi:hypothetical protein